MTILTRPLICSASLLFASLGISQVGTGSPNPAAFYIARTVFVDASARDSFVACLEQKELPIWLELKKQGVLADHSVFETTAVRSTEKDVPEWTFLLLSHLSQTATKESFLAAEESKAGKSPHGSLCADGEGARTRRLELLRSTPNSYYPRATVEENRQAIQEKISYTVEYIAVHETAAELDEYRELMRSTIGPGMPARIERKQTFSFTALETVSVIYAEAGLPRWNQIHVSGRSAAATAMAPVVAAGAAATQAKLAAIRTRPRIDQARQLFNLAVR